MERSARLLGERGMEKLNGSRVLLFGLGGVGSAAAEALARSGIGRLFLVDGDVVSESNRNRQILATTDTVGREKTAVMKERIAKIRPETQVETRTQFFLPSVSGEYDFGAFDYVADAVDTVTAKLEILRCAREAGVPVISCMGTGNRLDPTKLRVGRLSETRGCPLARVMRREVRRLGLGDPEVVFSTEVPLSDGQRAPGSVPWVPPAAGMILAGHIVRRLLETSD